MPIESDKAVYGLVGKNIHYSLSPLMHNAAFETLELEAVYQLFSLDEDELDSFFAELKEDTSPIFGLNVTVPYKEKALTYLDSYSPLVEKIKAVNTIVISPERKLVGHNTDAPGFLAHLHELNVDVADKHIAFLGAGGASRAILCALCLLPEKPRSIKIFDIDKDKATYLIQDLGERLDVRIIETVNAIDDLNIFESDLLINATPMGAKEEDPLLVDPDMIHSGLMVYDLIYNPAQTSLLKMARSRGAQTSNGLGMLYFQGVLAFQHWAGIELEENVKQIMRKKLEP